MKKVTSLLILFVALASAVIPEDAVACHGMCGGGGLRINIRVAFKKKCRRRFACFNNCQGGCFGGGFQQQPQMIGFRQTNITQVKVTNITNVNNVNVNGGGFGPSPMMAGNFGGAPRARMF